MKIKLLRALAILIILVLAGCAPAPTVTPGDLEAEEYAVYSALIKTWYIGDAKLIVFQDRTSVGQAPFPAAHLPGVPDEVVADFKAKNRQSYPLKPRFDLQVRYVLMTDQERGEIFQDFGAAWDKFYKRYPDSKRGIMTLSRVGFNAQMDKALVYVGWQAGELTGRGEITFLVKENDAWKIRDQWTLWIS